MKCSGGNSLLLCPSKSGCTETVKLKVQTNKKAKPKQQQQKKPSKQSISISVAGKPAYREQTGSVGCRSTNM